MSSIATVSSGSHQLPTVALPPPPTAALSRIPAAVASITSPLPVTVSQQQQHQQQQPMQLIKKTVKLPTAPDPQALDDAATMSALLPKVPIPQQITNNKISSSFTPVSVAPASVSAAPPPPKKRQSKKAKQQLQQQQQLLLQQQQVAVAPPLPAVCSRPVQVQFTSALPVAPVPAPITLNGGNNLVSFNTNTNTTMANGSCGVTVAPAMITPAQPSTPAAPCTAQIVTVSMKELRMKGSSFLRTHASKHGITNASRKLTAAVIQELVNHYINVHKINMTQDDSASNTAAAAAMLPAGSTIIHTTPAAAAIVKKVVPQLKKIPSHNSATTTQIILPPKPPQHTIVISNGHGENDPPVISIKEETISSQAQTFQMPHVTVAQPLPLMQQQHIPQQQTMTVQLPQHPLPPVHVTQVPQLQPLQLTQLQPQPITIELPTKPLPLMESVAPLQPPPPTQHVPIPVPAKTPKRAVASRKINSSSGTIVVTSPLPNVQRVIDSCTATAVVLTTTAPVPTSLSMPMEPVVVQATTTNGDSNSAVSPNGNAPGSCKAPVMAKTRLELSTCGTSLLRPEAAAHKVHNASRKPKDQVVEELWKHYLTVHAVEISSIEMSATSSSAAPLTVTAVQAATPSSSSIAIAAPSPTNGLVALATAAAASSTTVTSTRPTRGNKAGGGKAPKAAPSKKAPKGKKGAAAAKRAAAASAAAAAAGTGGAVGSQERGCIGAVVDEEEEDPAATSSTTNSNNSTSK